MLKYGVHFFLLTLAFFSTSLSAYREDMTTTLSTAQLSFEVGDVVGDAVTWEVKDLPPFDELLISWNAFRPKQGSYKIAVSLYEGKWSPLVDYAKWGAEGQSSFKRDKQENLPKIFQDVVCPREDFATGFRVVVTAEKGASLANIFALHVSISDLLSHQVESEVISEARLDVVPLSQLALKDPRSRRLCSPISVAAVIGTLTGIPPSPLSTADRVYDARADIYGNWVLNIAEASSALGPDWRCYVTRLSSLDDLLYFVAQGTPVVVSVKGELPGAMVPYHQGHLMVVRGYDAESRQVLCMDPAYPSDAETLVSYPLEDFLRVWGERKGLVYLFVMTP